MRCFYFLILVVLAGCAKQPSAEPNNLIITAFSTSFDTKASEAAFEAGDIMGVFLEKNSGNNLRYETADGSVWKGFGNVGEFSSGDNVTAYFPYSSSATNMNAIEVSENVDFMITAPTPLTVTGSQAVANLKFKHVLSKLVVTIDRPEEIAGIKTVSLDSIIAKNVFRKGTIDLATEKITGLTDKGDLRAFGTSIIVIPQTVQKIEIVFKMANGEFDRLAYNEPIVLKTGEKTTFKATSNADLYFTSTLDLSSGEAQSNLDLSFYVAPGRTWKLTSSAPWLTVKPTTGVGPATVKVSVTANNSAIYKPRATTITLSDDKPASKLMKVTQNYIRKHPVVEIGNAYWTTANLGATTPQAYGNFYKWGSTYVYDRSSGNVPAGHWGGGPTNGAASQPIAKSNGYNYTTTSPLGGNVGGPAGDPCESLGKYRTPTNAQWMSLGAANNNNSVWVTLNGTAGRLFGIHGTAANAIISSVPANCIFLPAAGSRNWGDGLLSNVGTNAFYWSSSVYDANYGYIMSFVKNGVINHGDIHWRSLGLSVRCVAQ